MNIHWNNAARRNLLCIAVAVGVSLAGTVSFGAALVVRPDAVTFDHPNSSTQLLVSRAAQGELLIDRTHDVQFQSLDPAVAVVDERGVVAPRGDGQTRIVVVDGEDRVEIPVDVTRYTSPPLVSFRDEVLPVLNKAGCMSSSCHGKQGGQNGFQLSVFNFDPVGDYEAIVKGARGRRVAIARPLDSLFLRKAAGIVPHSGGPRIQPGSAGYNLIARWIREGASYEGVSPPPVVRIEIEPKDVVLSFQQTQQLRVTAVDRDGDRRCVTVDAVYESNVPQVAGVEPMGRVDSSDVPGEAAILVKYMGHVSVCRVTVPQPDTVFQRPPENGFVDKLVWDKLERLGIAASGPADDGMFLRRVFLDTIGTLPTAQESRAYLQDTAEKKRELLVDRLLQRDEYAVYWAMRWADILKVDSVRIGPQNAVAINRWLRQQFRANVPYDQFVRNILTAKGTIAAASAVPVYQALGEELGPSVSQLFLGVRLGCAKCHQHPSERWNPRDFYAFGGFFTGVATQGPNLVPVAGKDLENQFLTTGEKETVPAAALGAAPADFSSTLDRREVLVDWMTAPDNPLFARLIVNRLWAHYFGRGIFVDIDDQRETNPPTNEPLLNALAAHLRDLDYDIKAFTRTLLLSGAYALSSVPNESNVRDQQNYSHASYKPMPAEVLLDAICQVTRVPEKFNGWPVGYRAIQLWDNHVPSYFFDIFGRPARLSVCECERGTEPSIAQALYVMNSPEFARKIGHRHGLARSLANSSKTPQQIITEVFLSTLSRFPSAAEQDSLLPVFTQQDRRTATEDVLWTLLNSKRFLYVH